MKFSNPAPSFLSDVLRVFLRVGVYPLRTSPRLVLLLLPLSLSAAQTHTWTQGDASDYDKAILTHLSLRSDGRLTLAPATRELYDTTAGYLWALARDSKGNLYTGGGTGA